MLCHQLQKYTKIRTPSISLSFLEERLKASQNMGGESEIAKHIINTRVSIWVQLLIKKWVYWLLSQHQKLLF